jgi:hypothetical protein
MQVTFNPGISTLYNVPDESGDETTIQKYQRLKKEKRAKNSRNEQPPVASHSISPERESQFGKRPSNHDILATSHEADHFDMKAVMKAQKKSRKRNVNKNTKASDSTQPTFWLDPDDDRFKSLHRDHRFAVDPSNAK